MDESYRQKNKRFDYILRKNNIGTRLPLDKSYDYYYLKSIPKKEDLVDVSENIFNTPTKGFITIEQIAEGITQKYLYNKYHLDNFSDFDVPSDSGPISIDEVDSVRFVFNKEKYLKKQEEMNLNSEEEEK